MNTDKNQNQIIKEHQELEEKWKPILNAEKAPQLKDKIQRDDMLRLLKNEEEALNKQMQNESVEGTSTGDVATWKPVMIDMLRRTMPTLIAYDIIGVQPMDGPTSLIFAMQPWYGKDPKASGAEKAFTSEAPKEDFTGPYKTKEAEKLGQQLEADTSESPALVTQVNPWPEMSFTVESQTVTAQSRALKAQFTDEMETDLRKTHGGNAEEILSSILSNEIIGEKNREIVNTVYNQAKVGAQQFSPSGIYNLNTDADGRWAVEKYKSLIQQVGKEAQLIAQETRRGVGNWVITSPYIANAFDMTGMVDTTFTPGSFSVDPVGVSFAGRLAGKMNLYIDPYATDNTITVGYKGNNPYDAGYFYNPYVPLQYYKGQSTTDFQTVIGFKTRYGMTHNPYVSGKPNENSYFRKFKVINL